MNINRPAITIVALRKESVDRNYCSGYFCFPWLVALRKESVDRNTPPMKRRGNGLKSLSARRAWIEI